MRPQQWNLITEVHTVSVAGNALDPEIGSKVLLEGNYFNTVRCYRDFYHLQQIHF